MFKIRRFLPGNENFTLVINMDSKTQYVRLSDQILNLPSLLSVVAGSKTSNFDSG